MSYHSGGLTGTLGHIVESHNRPPKRKPLVDPKRTGHAARKGTLNLRAVAEVLQARGLDPTEELIDIIQADPPVLDADVRARLLTTLLEYVHPKKKSVEITGAEGGPVQIENVSDAVLVQIAMSGIHAEALEEDPAAPALEEPWPFPRVENKTE